MISGNQHCFVSQFIIKVKKVGTKFIFNNTACCLNLVTKIVSKN